MSNKHDLTINQGSTFEASIVWKESDGTIKNLAGYTARMQVRPSYNSSTITESLTTETGEITIIPEVGTIVLELNATRTEQIKVQMGSGKPPKSLYVYDLELEDAEGHVTRLLFGDVIVIGEVTR